MNVEILEELYYTWEDEKLSICRRWKVRLNGEIIDIEFYKFWHAENYAQKYLN